MTNLMLVSLWIMLFSFTQANAHWFYSAACCGEEDCRPAEPGEILEHLNGWYVPETDTLFTWGRVNEAPDGQFHICEYYPKSDKPILKTRCIYVPPMGS